MDSKIPSPSQAEWPEGDGILFLRRDGVPSLSSSSPRRWWRRTFRAGRGPAYRRFVWPESALVMQVRKEAGLLRYCGRPAFFVYRLCCVARRLSEFVGCEDKQAVSTFKGFFYQIVVL